MTHKAVFSFRNFLFPSLTFIFSPIIPAGTLANLAAKMQRGSCCPPATPEEPISFERAKPPRVMTDDRSSVFLFFLVYFLALSGRRR